LDISHRPDIAWTTLHRHLPSLDIYGHLWRMNHVLFKLKVNVALLVLSAAEIEHVAFVAGSWPNENEMAVDRVPLDF
jgi:hypothetical protein